MAHPFILVCSCAQMDQNPEIMERTMQNLYNTRKIIFDLVTVTFDLNTSIWCVSYYCMLFYIKFCSMFDGGVISDSCRAYRVDTAFGQLMKLWIDLMTLTFNLNTLIWCVQQSHLGIHIGKVWLKFIDRSMRNLEQTWFTRANGGQTEAYILLNIKLLKSQVIFQVLNDAGS